VTDHADRLLPKGRADCTRCAALEARCALLEDRVRALEAVIADLRDRLRADSSNSSNAPSSDPLWAPNLRPKKPTGRRPGGQRGHEGHHREPLSPDQVDAVVEHAPARCGRCGAALGSGLPREVRSRHQVAELPPRAAVVTEHRSCAVACPRCGGVTAEPLPPAVRRSCCGPRLSAALCYLSARVHGSRRAAEDVARELLGCPLSLGTVSDREAELSEALEAPYAAVQARVRAAPVKHVDETGWRRAARWLWVAATRDAALFRLARGRDWNAARNLLGELVRGVVCSDRFGVYDRLKVGRRAVCWAHLKRDFQRWVDRGGATRSLGEEGLAITRGVFRLWRRFKGRQVIRSTLWRRLAPLRARMRRLLARGMRGNGGGKATRFCRNVARVFDALWTFARVPGVEPTNNHAERMLRPAVCWRKACLGSHADRGCRYAERVLTALQTLKLRGRPALDFLAEAIAAHRAATPAPALV
jgi:transposase